MIGATIALGRTNKPPSTLVLADWTARLGQDLFIHPTWAAGPGAGRGFPSRSLVGRANFAVSPCRGVARRACPAPIDAGALASQQGKPCDCAGVTRAAAALLFGSEPGRRGLTRSHGRARADQRWSSSGRRLGAGFARCTTRVYGML